MVVLFACHAHPSVIALTFALLKRGKRCTNAYEANLTSGQYVKAGF